MRSLAYLIVTALCVCSSSSSSAQQTPVGPDPSTVGPNAAANTASPAPSAAAPAPAAVVSSPPVPAPNGALTSPPVGAPLALVTDEKVERADAWVAFEQQRDVRTQRGERVFPFSLAVQAGFGATLAVVADEDASTTTRALFGAAGGLSAAALLPSMLAKSRDARRAWFGVGSAAFAVGLGASLISLENDHSKRENDPSHGAGNWIGAAVAVQGLAVLPIGLIPGWPSENDYEAYTKLPPEARPDAAARLLLQIDRYEQRVTAWLVLSNLVALGVLGMGAIVNDDKKERQAIGLVSIVPLATALIGAVPRLFVASRNERLSLGQGPTRLGFNAW